MRTARRRLPGLALPALVLVALAVALPGLRSAETTHASGVTATLELVPAFISEDGGVSAVRATLPTAVTADTVITVSAAAVSPAVAGDFTLSSGVTLTIAAGETESTGVVTITATDNAVKAANKTVTVSGTSGNSAVTNPAGVTLLIAEDDYDCSGSTAIGSTSTLEADCEALLASRDVLRGTGSLNWSEGLAMSSWTGVTVSGGRVTRLNLSSLSGSIPAALGDLSGLTWLDLASNALSGSIPAELGDLSSLTYLDLSSNGLSGSIPEDLGDLSALGTLNLSSNALSGSIPEDLGDLASLFTLDLSGNALSGSIPDDLGDLASMFTLDLSDNALSGSIPAELGSAAFLGNLDLSDNALSGSIPAELGSLSFLSDLNLSGNALSGSIPAALASAAFLGNLDLSDNALSGPIPAALAGLFLTELDLSGNSLTGTVTLELDTATVSEGDGATQVTVTATLDAGTAWANTFADGDDDTTEGSTVTVSVSGSGEEDAVDFAAVQSFTITIAQSASSATGAFTLTPSDDSELEADETVTVTATGTGATHIADVALSAASPHPTIIVTDDDQVSPTLALVPAFISEDGGVSAVRATLPTAVTTDTVITVSAAAVSPAVAGDFTLSRNVTLTIAAGETESTGVVTITAEDNRATAANKTVTLSGASGNSKVADPASVTLLIAEDDYDCSGSTAIGSTSTLEADCEALLASRDVLRGAGSLNWSEGLAMSSWNGVAVSRGRVTSLVLSGSSLSGSIPAALGDLPALQQLDLSSNSLSGSIPAELGGLAFLAQLNLSSNSLSGSIPADLGDLPVLAQLNLSGNALSGSIPGELGDLSFWTLSQLDLSGNDLTGSIPAALGKLTRLQSLDLSGNDLSDSIPEELDGLALLAELDLSGNSLTGTVTLELDTATVSEGGGATQVTVTATLDAGTAWANQFADGDDATTDGSTVTVAVSGSGAEGAVDFAAVQSFTFTIAQSASSATGAFTLTPGDDNELEADETVTVTATGTGATNIADVALSAASPAPTIIVTDDELPRATLALGPAFISEHEGVSVVTATLSEAVTTDTVITVSAEAVAPAAASDFILGRSATLGRHATLTIAAGETESTGAVTITAVDNAVQAANKTVTVRGVSGNGAVASPARVTLLIAEDDYDCSATPGVAQPHEHHPGGAAPGVAQAAPQHQPEDDHDDHDDDDDHDGLEADCEALLAARDVLRGTGSLNWSEDLDISNWDGVTVAAEADDHDLEGGDDGDDDGDDGGRVTGLDLSGRSLNGSIPALLGDLSHLQHLDLSGNSLHGSIPAELDHLSELVRLLLSGNALSGSIPAALGELSSLRALDLSGNALRGSIPGELGDLSGLVALNLSSNALSGSIPATLGGLGLNWLDLSDNVLSGSIPATLANLTLVTRLDLSGNSLTGTVTLELDTTTVSEGDSATEVTVTATLDVGTAWANNFADGDDTTPDGSVVAVSVSGSGAEDAVDFAEVENFSIIIAEDASSGSDSFTLTPTADREPEADETVRVTATGIGAGNIADIALRAASPTPTITLTDDDAGRATAPGAVQNLTISKVAQASLTATWDAPDPAPTAAYAIELFEGIDTTGAAAQTRSLGPRQDPLKMQFTGLTPGTQYTVSVKVYNRAARRGGTGFVKSAASTTATATATTPPTPPGAPTNLTVKARSHAMIVRWDAPGGGAPTGKYVIELFAGASPAADATPDQVRDKGPQQEDPQGNPDRQVIFYGLTPDTTYTVSVKAYNRAANDRGKGFVKSAGPAVTATATTLALPDPPGPVTDLTLTQVQLRDLVVKWTPPDPAPSSYDIDVFEGVVTDTITELDADNLPRALHWTTRGKNAVSARFTLELGKTYTVSVKARNHQEVSGFRGVFVSDFSETTATIEMKDVPDAPGPVTGLTVKQVYTSGVEVEWTAPDPAPTGRYLVEWDNTQSGVVENALYGSKATGAYIANLAENSGYTIRVRARNWIEGVGLSDYSAVAEVSATTARPPAPGVVTGLAFDADKTTSTSLVATWTAPDPAPTGKYVIELFAGSSATGTPLTTRYRDPGLAREAKFTGLTKNAQYTISVRAEHAYSHERVAGPAATATATTGAAGGLPGRPTNLTFGSTTTTATSYSETLSWTAPADTTLDGVAIEKYIVRVYRRGDGGLEKVFGPVVHAPAQTTYQLRDLEYCTEYRVQVRTKTSNGVSPWATTWLTNEWHKSGGTEQNPTYTDKCATTE